MHLSGKTKTRNILAASLLGIIASPTVAIADAPLSYLTSFGPKADATVYLTWGLLIISIAVVVVISALVGWAVFRRREPSESKGPEASSHRVNNLNIFGWGLGLTTVILAACVGWTMVTLAEIGRPPTKPAVTIEVTGHQWWWQDS